MVTLDDFSFLVGGRSAAWRPVFRPPGRIFARKSVFCYRTPDFVNGPFVTLCETVDLAPSDRFLNFSFLSYGPKWPKMAIFGDSHLRRESTSNFGHFRLYDKHFSYFHGVTGKAGISSPTWILWPAEWPG